jgi:trimethylamine:corrinoid methyltransferase-like protein
MDIQVYGARREDGRLILDLGIQSRVDSGIEIQTAPQFMIEAEGETIEFDEGTTAELLRRPPEPFTIPPRTFIRFELAYETEAVPTSLRYRGYESEGTLAIPGLK